MIPQTPSPPAPGELAETLFPQTSRYHGLKILHTTTASGRQVAYVERRFLPPHDYLEVVQLHNVNDGDRIDNVSAHYLGDPELFWRVCDGNYELDPARLTSQVTRQIRITLPPGQTNTADV